MEVNIFESELTEMVEVKEHEQLITLVDKLYVERSIHEQDVQYRWWDGYKEGLKRALTLMDQHSSTRAYEQIKEELVGL